jgi:cytochrome c oxidase assembly protein subunit 15
VRLQRFAWLVLLYNVAVVVWGAYVRATGSGAGCGSHWPLCNGEVIPQSPSLTTVIEYSHRLTSGLALMSVVVLVIWIWRVCGPGHPARTGGVLSLFFMLSEAAVGAGLVLFQLVADNASMARALFMAVHLLNTFILLACIALTAWWLSGGKRLSMRAAGPAAAGVLAGCVALLIVGTSGSIAALGDTLFPSLTLEDALHADLSATSHLLIRLRVLHPVLAVAAALLLAILAPRLARDRGLRAERMAQAVIWLTASQLALGFLNVVLLAPVWLQLVHLLVADSIWIAFVLLGANALARESRPVLSRELSARSSGDTEATGPRGEWPVAARSARHEMRQNP